MQILKIRADMFRNYRHLEFSPHNNLNIIIGPNAQGKTNLLEAIFFNLKGYSYRTNDDKEVINWQNDYCNVTCLLENKGRKWQQSVALNKAGLKKYLINGVEKKRRDFSQVGVILFTPDDLELIKSSPAVRRKFIDHELGSFYSPYTHFIGKYNKILAQRNHLLKSIKASKESTDMLELWNQQLVDNGTSVLLLRLAMLKKLAPIAKKCYYHLTDGYEMLDIKYLSSLKIDGRMEEDSLKKRFYQVLKQMHPQEVRRCQTLVGPHRDDINFLINGKDARAYGSQGQQRTIVLSLKLALMTLYLTEFNMQPIVLLDDVLFELDQKRQKMLLNITKQGIQTFITTNNLNSQILQDHDYQLIRIKEGLIINNDQENKEGD